MPINKGYIITEKEVEKSLSKHVIRIEDSKELPDDGCFFVVIDIEYVSINCLYQLREKINYQLLPIFYIGHPPQHHEQILDGYFDEAAVERAKSLQSRMELIQAEKGRKIEDFEKLLSQYLFVRDPFILKGFLDYHSHTGIQYPLLEVIDYHNDPQHYEYMLHGMETRKLLKHEKLIDEIQACPFCSSGLLNFKNCCPNCQSIRITTQSFIHCFTCGNVGPLPEFLQGEELICSRCRTRLRHVGIDYDKPIEDKICQECHHFFFEPEVNAVCMVCNKLSDPADLPAKKLYEYRLARRGESLAQGIDQYFIVELSQFLKLIDLSIFMMIVHWQTLLARRYEQLSFSLMALSIQNEDELVATHGALKTERLFAEFFERIRTLLRSTDLVSRDNKTILFFLPMTPLEGTTTLSTRIKAFTEEQSINDSKIKLRTAMMTSSEILEKSIEEDLLLAELYNRIKEND
ncbi:diguanylate cyclase domain-containing protein [Legionella israelensis]|uniref:Uncharacterized protein n=1 Tax=Legionella israelensis TaxID=454 RepID=A0A0W0WG77_9GAMM|nr:diguanylate cyclase [Legionella israelensis]KTD31354.1 hypothetical protein Lisr_0665 [Legionella israelensis]QBS09839.1 diguanylate cyclase [Legionella israelensis]SCY13771.1 Diguanylate cyclase, GGDEF domain [Legionella israelensis DSM 19235]STX59397.1 Uncharacterised protein [Legionella israelensis]